MFGFKDRIDRAVGTLRGYCAKVKNCNKCRFVAPDGQCPFMLETPPCDFDMDDRRNRHQQQEAEK